MLRWTEAVHKCLVRGQPVLMLGEAQACQGPNKLWRPEVARPAMLRPGRPSYRPCCLLESDGGWSPTSPADLMLPLLMVQHAWQDRAA